MTTAQWILVTLACSMPELLIVALCAPQWWYTRNLPKPAAGQIWRSQHSGKCIRISGTRITDGGGLVWDYEIESDAEWARKQNDGFNPVSQSCYGLREWWLMLYQERRVLEGWKLPEPSAIPVMPPCRPARMP